MSNLNKKLLFTFLVASFAFINNNAIAVEQQNDINQDVLGYSYVNNTVLGDQQTLYDINQISQTAYIPTTNNKDISEYTSMTKKERQMEKMQNKYAVLDNDIVFEPTNAITESINLWIRPYASIEKVKLAEGIKLHTKTYGVYTGVNSGLKELGHGWDAVWGGYVGYTGAYINKEYFKTYQNGGTFGFESMFLKDNFFTGLAINTGAMSGEMSMFDISVTYINAGISNKTGYNWELADGKFIIQPNLITSYVFTHTIGHSKGNADIGASVDNDSLHSVLIEPGINFIGKFNNGWEPYTGVSVVWNIAHDNHIGLSYPAMPDIAIEPFVKYGVGVRKTWNGRFGANMQAFVRNGGRNGIGFNGGFNVALGK